MKDKQHCLTVALALFIAWDSQALAQNADETIALAREAAKTDRHAESIDAFRLAMAAAPERRREWLLELADQLTWSKRLGESIALYQEAARTKDRDEERRARRGLARALSWNGGYSAAISEYDWLLAMTPEDEELRLARAEVVSWVNQYADERAEIAREAAKADRHTESITAFRQAINAAPERRNEWLLELADQLTWSNRLEEAIALYREEARKGDRETERRARRGLARALSWAGEHRAAIREYDRVIAMAPDDREVSLARTEVVSWAHQEVDKIVELARDAAKADNHAEAIATYKRAMMAAPARRNEWLLELADQLTWSQNLKQAISLYREAAETGDAEHKRRARCGLARALAWNGEHAAALAEYDRVLAEAPSDREARLGRAKVLSWTNEQKAALLGYEAVLRDYPDDEEVLRGIARVQSWRGRHRDSAAGMLRFLEEHPRDREAIGILSDSYQWMGRPDRARRILREQTAADPGDTGAASALENLDFLLRPVVRFDWRESHQSDEVRTSVFSLDSSAYFADGAGVFGFRYDLASLVPPDGPVEEILVQRAGLKARRRFSDALEWNGGLFLDAIDTRGAPGDHDLVTYETYLTVFPNDLLRFDIGSSRWLMDSEETLREALNAVQGNVSVDFTPDELTKFAGRFSLADYSDGNDRSWWQFEMERRVWRQPDVVIGYRYTGFDFADPWQSGYYSPDLYHSNEILARASGWIGDRFRWHVRSTIGYEHELPGDTRLIWSAGGGVGWEITRQLEIELAYDFFSSSAAAANGFDRGTGRLGLRYVF